jgi:membrane protease YdiL (CAAX protease family)
MDIAENITPVKPANPALPIHQYRLNQILLIWAAAVVPMAILGWFVAPALARNSEMKIIVRQAVLTFGMIWQFALVAFLVYRETGTFRWSIVRRHLWLNTPSSPRTGKESRRLWLWLIPILVLLVIYEFFVGGIVQRLWVSAAPFLAEPLGFSFGAALDSPGAKAQFVGNWSILGIFLLSALFNTFLGEELLFRGVLLPRMSGVFGRWDWVMNGMLFGLYHLHQPWGILNSAIKGIFFYALPSRRFRSSWFGIIAHSAQSIYFIFLLLGLVLGLA